MKPNGIRELGVINTSHHEKQLFFFFTSDSRKLNARHLYANNTKYNIRTEPRLFYKITADANILRNSRKKTLKNSATAGSKTPGENFEGGEKNLFGGQKERKKEERRTVARGPFWISSVSLATGPRPSKAPWAHELFESSPLFSAASFITVTT